MLEQEAINEREWANPDNWSDFEIGLYFSKRDTRVRVPKRERELGWTINLAHPKGAPLFIALLLAPTALLLLLLIALVVRR